MSRIRQRVVASAIVVAGLMAAMPGAEPTGGAAVSPQDAPQQPTFRSGATAVAVDVTVRDRSRRSITGLAATDFQVFDNGVRQEVAEVSYGKLPIDVTVALDVSYSVTGALLERLRRGVVQLMGDLGREDRLKLMLFNMRVTRTTDFTRDVRSVERAIREATAGGGTALLDAVSVALVSSATPDRRQLVVFFTDGGDSSSITTPAMLTAVAQRTRATLTFVMPGSFPILRTAVGSSGDVRVVSAGVTPAPPRPLDALFRTLAAETGGSILSVGASTDLTATFRRALEEFRSTYVLYYNARGVDRGGYHAIEVRVPREGVVVQARRGYFSS